MDPTGTVLTIICSIVGMEVIKKIAMDKIFPPPEPIFGETEKQLLTDIELAIKTLPTECPTLTKEEHEYLSAIHNLIVVKDNDGVPLTYAPRSWQKTQDDILKVSQDIAFAQRETANTLNSMVKVMDRLADKVAGLQ